jgi:peptidoglycan/xylan/chitin deacetylase (PgdA/CDA1 family)
VVSVPELLALPIESDAVALTFDDALASVASEAAPLLEGHGLRATVFAVTDHVGSDNRWGGTTESGIPAAGVLDWDALGRLMLSGWSVGSHTRRHSHLTRCSNGELQDELEGSAEAIERHLGVRPTSFAYPYGETNAHVAAATAAVYPLAFTTEYLALDLDCDRSLIPRLDAWYFRGAADFQGWGTPRFRRGIALRHALRRMRRALR